jgi:hypothetical protein
MVYMSRPCIVNWKSSQTETGAVRDSSNRQTNPPSPVRRTVKGTTGHPDRGTRRLSRRPIGTYSSCCSSLNREVIEYIFSQLAEDELQPAVSRELFTALLERYRQTGRIEASGLLNDERFGRFSGLISELLTVRYEISKYWESISGFEEIPVNLQLSVDAVRTIKKRSIKERVEEVRKKMHEVERQGGDSIALARELQILQREIKLIDKQYTSYHKSKES